MDIQDLWEKALQQTEVIRPRIAGLKATADTRLSYIFLARSSVNEGDTVVRKGQVVVEKPYIVMPSNLPQFEGFEFEEELELNEDILVNFFLVRGIRFPSMRYNNKTQRLDIFEGGIDKAVSFYANKLQKAENVETGLLVGPEDTWQFSVLIFICSQVARSINTDIRKLLDEMERRDPS